MPAIAMAHSDQQRIGFSPRANLTDVLKLELWKRQRHAPLIWTFGEAEQRRTITEATHPQPERIGGGEQLLAVSQLSLIGRPIELLCADGLAALIQA